MSAILLTGATGYIGGRLLRRLEEGGRGLMFRGMLRRIAERAERGDRDQPLPIVP